MPAHLHLDGTALDLAQDRVGVDLLPHLPMG